MQPVYNIPLACLDRYRDKPLIVRADESHELVTSIPDPENIHLLYVQIPSSSNVEALANWGLGVPIDVLMQDPAVDFGSLYRHAKLLDKHPVRISICVSSGFLKALKVATALRFAVKLVMQQPSQQVIPELLDAANFFLHRGEVCHPIEFFNSLMLAFFHREPTSIWHIQEEDIDEFLYVPSDGLEKRIDTPERKKLTANDDCNSCHYLQHCQGYFKRGGPDFDCSGVRTIFATLKSAAEELRTDLHEFDELKGQVQL